MKEAKSNLGTAWWAKNLDDIDREVARLATICNVRILDPGIIERVLQGDESVCGTKNAIAFRKLREALQMHYHIRDRTVGIAGPQATAQVVTEIVERLRARIGDRLGGPGAK